MSGTDQWMMGVFYDTLAPAGIFMGPHYEAKYNLKLKIDIHHQSMYNAPNDYFD